MKKVMSTRCGSMLERAMLDSAREVCESVKVGRKNPNNMWWNDVVKAAVERNEAAWKVVLGYKYDIAKER